VRIFVIVVQYDQCNTFTPLVQLRICVVAMTV